MKKTLMALAVGAAFAAPSAFADVTISGAINMSIEYVNMDSGASPGKSNTLRTVGPQESVGNFGIAPNYTNITISSVDDLGGGLKLDFAAQIDWNTANSNALANRNSHIGIVSEHWGGVWYGTNENIYERYFYSVDPLDGAAGLGGNLQILGNPGVGNRFDNCTGSPVLTAGCRAGFYRRDQNTVWYDSPNWWGLTFGGAIGLNQFKDQVQGTDPYMWQLGAKWVGPHFPLALWAAYAQHNDYFGLADITANTSVPTGAAGTATLPANNAIPGLPGTGGTFGGNGTVFGFQDGLSSDDQAIQAGIGYTLGDIWFYGNYERLKYKTDGLAAQTIAPGVAFTPISEFRRDAWSVGTKWNLASGYIGAQFLMGLEGKCEAVGAGCNADDTGAWSVGLGYYHTMSKQTQVYIVGSYIANDDLAVYQSGGVKNNNANGFASNLGSNIWGAGIGIKHSF